MKQPLAKRGYLKSWAVLLFALIVVLGGCNGRFDFDERHQKPLSTATKNRLSKLKMEAGAPMLVRIYKQESELEVWKKRSTDGKFALFRRYEICSWSGRLGPKFKEGDRQAPEGFYTITPGLMNPKSSYYLAFNLGFPNTYDRAHGRTGSHLMVHGSCSSRGCYAMRDEQIEEIYQLARESFAAGEASFQVQAFPFRMSAENLDRYAHSPHAPFWRMLKEGADHFEATRQPPRIDVCDRRYVFNAAPLREGDVFEADKPCPAYQTPGQISRALAAYRERGLKLGPLKWPDN